MSKTFRVTCLLAALTLMPALAFAQLPMYGRSRPATGERYNVEFAAGIWDPSPDITIASGSLQRIGTDIDAINDLGFAQKKLTEIKVILRPAKKHKFRFDYIPISYSAETVLTRSITFRGITYTVGLPVHSSLDWKAYHFGYEYDLVYRDRGFFGVIGEVKYTTVRASVASPIESAATEQHAPIPAIGGIARGYLAQNVSITGELTGFKLPESLSEDTRGRYVDFDIYGTVNFNNNVGVQAGYRSLDAKFQVSDDSGSLKLRGIYFRGVVRF